ncbi:MAG TPA: phosphoribosylformylglycinamidine synthase subunit PurS [Bacteroidota bacterium]|nr:phosphoribosylformylglycinamidine synthase subunit PurS [Bacteroidota bacterium]
MYQATITITLRTSILDVQGKAVEHGIHSLGMSNVSNVRIGKHIELTIDAADEAEAKRITDEACRKILANQVMEDYTYTVKKA